MAILVLALAGAGHAQNKPLKKVRVGVPSVGVANIIIFIAKEGKLYEKHGLDAEVITVNGSGIGSKALISGGIDIIPIATPTVIAANLAGADMQILAHTMPGVVHAMMVKPEIKRVEDFKGKKIGVSSLGSLTDFLVRTIARKKGLNPDRDLTLIVMGGDAERLTALRAGAVDAAAMSHPGYGRARRMGFQCSGTRPKRSTIPGWKSPRAGTTIKKDRELVTHYMKAHLEGIALFKKDPEFSKRVIKKTLRMDEDDLVAEAYEIYSKAFIPAPYPNLPGMKVSFEYVGAEHKDVWKHKPEEFADASFVTELDKSGFIKSLYGK